MILSLLFATICLAIPQSSARGVPFYELDDESLPEMNTLLQESLFRKARPEPGHPREVRGWGVHTSLGQVTGVSVNPNGNPVIIHRASRDWAVNSFNASEHFQMASPLREDVVLTLDRSTGDVIHSWGRGHFYLPHGLTVDTQGNIWITDVGLHQVLKFPPNSEVPSLILGEKLQPGSDDKHFCKPTSVAVASSGDFFVSDGYCNGRVLKFSPQGQLKAKFGHLGDDGVFTSLVVPHGIALHEKEDILCIADREHARIICIHAGIQNPAGFGRQISEITQPYNFRVFDVAFIGRNLFGVAGSKSESLSLGVTADVERGDVVDMWAPLQMFNNPHAIATDENTNAIYVTEVGPNRVWKFIIDPQPKSRF